MTSKQKQKTRKMLSFKFVKRANKKKKKKTNKQTKGESHEQKYKVFLR